MKASTRRRPFGVKPMTATQVPVTSPIRFTVAQSSLGSILVAMSDKGVCAIMMGDDPNKLMRKILDKFPRAALTGVDPDLEQLAAKVVAFVENPRIGLDLPLDVEGTAFQRRVWQAIMKIPVGQTATYTEIAEHIGSPTSVRVVAQACGANPVALAIPCHRIIRKDGDLAGYGWGAERKRKLLEREADL